MNLYRKYIKQGLAFLLLLIIVCTSVPYAYATEDDDSKVKTSSESKDDEDDEEDEKKQEELDRLEDERQQTLDAIDDLKDSINSVQKDINSLKSEKNNIQSYINQLDKKMNTLAKEIASFEEQIDGKINDIEETKEELEQAKIACDKQYESMKMRIQFIYENPSQSLFEMILSSNNVADLINRADYVASMSSYDRSMMDKMIETKEEIALKEVTLEAELEELELMQAELEKQKKSVNANINAKKGELSAKNNELGNANADQAEYKKQLEEQERLLNEIEEQIARTANPDAYKGSITGFIWPCPSYTRISSYFGPRPQPTAGASTNHKGVDLAAPYGSAILASAAGVVTTSTYSKSAGNYIVVAHGNGMSTVYMHCSALLVSVGETVEQGEKIAKVGSTGYSTGNHLHFGVIKNGSYVNPLNYISP
jgi:murein DD-endopeptidase MepM/ murein hydrolase activator NlpD